MRKRGKKDRNKLERYRKILECHWVGDKYIN